MLDMSTIRDRTIDRRAAGDGRHRYDRTGERIDPDDDEPEPSIPRQLGPGRDTGADSVRCRYGSIIAADGACCWRWPHR